MSFYALEGARNGAEWWPELQRNGCLNCAGMAARIGAEYTETDLGRIKEELSLRGTNLDKESQVSRYAETDEMGVFYLIQLEPDHDPCRFKVGFAVNMPDRLRAHRCAAPFSKVVKKWPCKRLWEKTAIDCITATCARLHTEVYRSQSLDDIIKKADDFFNLMPEPAK